MRGSGPRGRCAASGCTRCGTVGFQISCKGLNEQIPRYARDVVIPSAARDLLSELEPRTQAMDTTATIRIRRIRQAWPFARDLAFRMRIPTRPAIGIPALRRLAMRSRDIRQRKIRRVHRDDLPSGLD